MDIPRLWRRTKYHAKVLHMTVFKTDCPVCDGMCGYYSWDEPPEHCGYCDDQGIVYRHKAWEWRHFIEKNLLPPSAYPLYILNRIRYKDCPAPASPDWFHFGCKVCNGKGLVRRFGGGPFA